MSVSDSSDQVSTIIMTINLQITIRYFKKMLFIFSSAPFYTDYIKLPTTTDMPDAFCENSKFMPFFKHAPGAIDVLTAGLHHNNKIAVITTRGE